MTTGVGRSPASFRRVARVGLEGVLVGPEGGDVAVAQES